MEKLITEIREAQGDLFLCTDLKQAKQKFEEWKQKTDTLRETLKSEIKKNTELEKLNNDIDSKIEFIVICRKHTYNFEAIMKELETHKKLNILSNYESYVKANVLLSTQITYSELEAHIERLGNLSKDDLVKCFKQGIYYFGEKPHYSSKYINCDCCKKTGIYFAIGCDPNTDLCFHCISIMASKEHKKDFKSDKVNKEDDTVLADKLTDIIGSTDTTYVNDIGNTKAKEYKCLMCNEINPVNLINNDDVLCVHCAWISFTFSGLDRSY